MIILSLEKREKRHGKFMATGDFLLVQRGPVKNTRKRYVLVELKTYHAESSFRITTVMMTSSFHLNLLLLSITIYKSACHTSINIEFKPCM